MKRSYFDASIACALLAWAAGARSAPVSMPDIDLCISRLDTQLDIGYDRIAARCPELARQLERGAWAAWLPQGWKEAGNDLSAGGLRELRDVVNRESAATLPPATPDVRRLKSILVELTGMRSETGWSRFKAWLRSILERREEQTDEGWLTRMVSHVGVSQSVIRLVTYAALAGVVMLAGVIVGNEMRNAGLLPGWGAAARKRRQSAVSPATGPESSDFEHAALAEKPRLLLEMIVRRLGDRGWLPPAGAMTIRELTQAARLPDDADRSRLTDVASASELVRYSAQGTQPGGLDESIARGRELLDRLNAGTSR